MRITVCKVITYTSGWRVQSGRDQGQQSEKPFASYSVLSFLNTNNLVTVFQHSCTQIDVSYLYTRYLIGLFTKALVAFGNVNVTLPLREVLGLGPASIVFSPFQTARALHSLLASGHQQNSDSTVKPWQLDALPSSRLASNQQLRCRRWPNLGLSFHGFLTQQIPCPASSLYVAVTSLASSVFGLSLMMSCINLMHRSNSLPRASQYKVDYLSVGESVHLF
ncbi:hypothetical protein N657DRAFT_449210 [Parathielavia appendiculata]|uniref:Uncharacterized protein n=1 Tax=Parathielavia appendiculata TaxID=2587402 RepID=A0AAN6TYV5_9PEZI|nr:hypothetical protein N657DRAFT_449210 [Parathielavia appendiculata]